MTVRAGGGGDDHGVNPLAVPIRANVRCHPAIPLVAFAGLVPCRRALLFLILGGGRRGNPCGGHQRAFAQPQAARGPVGGDGGEAAFAQAVRFGPPPEFPERGGIRHPLGSQLNAGQALECLPVVARGFEGFGSPPIPLLEEIDPQPALQPDGRPSAVAFGLERFAAGQPFRPRNEGFQAREKLRAAGELLWIGKLRWGKTRLMGQAQKFRKPCRNRR